MSPNRARHIVITDQSHGLPYSKGLMASSLMVCGLPPTQAFEIAERIEETLTQRGVSEIKSKELRDLAASMLTEAGEQYATTYLKWQAVEELDLPLIVLIGGATGVGKSTLATQLATRLGITRVISTDAVREVLRAAFSRDLMPTLHASSFDAGTMLTSPLPARSDPVITGFREQVSAVAVGIKALITRAVGDGTDMIIEGAHVVPGFLEGWEQEFKDAVLVPVVISVSSEEFHRNHFYMRSWESRSRPGDRYLTSFSRIRTIQAYINQLAAGKEVPVVEAFDLDTTLADVITIILERALAAAQARGDAVKIEIADKEEAIERVAAAHADGKPKLRLKSWQVFRGRRRTS